MNVPYMMVVPVVVVLVDMTVFRPLGFHHPPFVDVKIINFVSGKVGTGTPAGGEVVAYIVVEPVVSVMVTLLTVLTTVNGSVVITYLLFVLVPVAVPVLVASGGIGAGRTSSFNAENPTVLASMLKST